MKIKSKKMFRLLSFFFVFTQSFLYAQENCECNLWEKAYHTSSGVKFEYLYSCFQRSSEWRFVKNDPAYCKKLEEDRKREIENAKRTKEAIEISNNTEKQKIKDGYTVIKWWGKYLGNTGKWDEVGNPRIGIKADSTFVAWSDDGKIILKGKVSKTQGNNLAGILFLGDDSSPISLFKEIRKYFDLNDISWKPDFVYYIEKSRYETIESAISQDILVELGNGLYSDKNRQNIFRYYYIKNGKVTLFSKPIDEDNASRIHNEICLMELKNELKEIRRQYDYVKKIIEEKEKKTKLVNDDITLIKNRQLSEIEANLIGKWILKSKFISSGSSNFLINLSETITFNSDRTFIYEGEIKKIEISSSYTFEYSDPNSYIHSTSHGVWEISDGQIIFYKITPENSNDENLKELILSRINEKLEIIDNIESKMKSPDFIWYKPDNLILINEEDNSIKNMMIIGSLFIEEVVEKNDGQLLEKLYNIVFSSNEKTNFKFNIKYNKLKSNKVIFSNLNFKETLLYQFKNSEIDNMKNFEEKYDNFLFTVIGKKQK